MGRGEETVVEPPGNIEGRNHRREALSLVPSGGRLVCLRKGKRGVIGRDFPRLGCKLPVKGKVDTPVQETHTGGVRISGSDGDCRILGRIPQEGHILVGIGHKAAGKGGKIGHEAHAQKSRKDSIHFVRFKNPGQRYGKNLPVFR